MEDIELQDKPGFFTRIANKLSGRNEFVDDHDYELQSRPMVRLSPVIRYNITIRRQIVSFQDAIAAADGLKRGEQQILNLTAADSITRDKIKDFMCGVNYAQEGTWEELGENVYLLAPPQAEVEVAPSTPRMTAKLN